jgi:hypothetical protein
MPMQGKKPVFFLNSRYLIKPAFSGITGGFFRLLKFQSSLQKNLVSIHSDPAVRQPLNALKNAQNQKCAASGN